MTKKCGKHTRAAKSFLSALLTLLAVISFCPLPFATSHAKAKLITVYLSVWPGLNLGLAPAALADLASTSTTYAKSLYFTLASKDFLTTDTAANGKGRPCMY